jgi:hypothetical protein
MTAAPANPLVAFYRDGAPDDQERTLLQILAWDDDRLEAVHDYIQWLFPLRERSEANPSAPVLDPLTIGAFRAAPVMRERLRQSFDRLLRFYGLRWQLGPAGPVIGRADNFPSRAQIWLRLLNHNHLRLTRILRSTHLLGLTAESAALLDALKAVYAEFPDRITPRTFAYWIEAAEQRSQS